MWVGGGVSPAAACRVRSQLSSLWKGMADMRSTFRFGKPGPPRPPAMSPGSPGRCGSAQGFQLPVLRRLQADAQPVDPRLPPGFQLLPRRFSGPDFPPCAPATVAGFTSRVISASASTAKVSRTARKMARTCCPVRMEGVPPPTKMLTT